MAVRRHTNHTISKVRSVRPAARAPTVERSRAPISSRRAAATSLASVTLTSNSFVAREARARDASTLHSRSATSTAPQRAHLRETSTHTNSVRPRRTGAACTHDRQTTRTIAVLRRDGRCSRRTCWRTATDARRCHASNARCNAAAARQAARAKPWARKPGINTSTCARTSSRTSQSRISAWATSRSRASTAA